ncbi:ATP-binding protein [Streptomyces sp. NPDC020681]|uniref:ATP-binding protein n=1 Tax=Streptomyces sp. NPDC020681 TaxID=3365083 RepID=UPI0037A4BCBF
MSTETESLTPQLPATVRVFRQRFSATRHAARLARLLTLQQLDAWGVPYGSEPSDTAASIVAELASNAVLHGRVPGRDFELALTLRMPEEQLRIEVSDTRADLLPRPPGSPAASDAESGRGLLLVEALATSWGVEDGPPPRKTAWAELLLNNGHTRPAS